VPKGVGALFFRRGTRIDMDSTCHEQGRRAGTENVLLDVGLRAACEVATRWIECREPGRFAIVSRRS
jgi:cysteine desulfurase